MALKTQDFSYTQNKGGINYTYILRVTQNSVDAQKNCSNVTVDAILKSDKEGTSFYFQYFEVYAYLNGSKAIGASAYRSCVGTEEHVFESWTGEVGHDENGEFTIVVEGALLCLESGYSWLPFISREAFGTHEFICDPIILNSPPDIPQGLTAPALVVAAGDVYIQWQMPEDPDGNLTGFELERSDDGGESFNLLYSGSDAAFPDEASSVAGTEMTYRVRAYDAQGAYSDWSDIVTVKVNSPPSLQQGYEPKLFMDEAGCMLAETITAGRPLWLYPGRWTDPDRNLDAGYLFVGVQAEYEGGAVTAWAEVQMYPVEEQLIRILTEASDRIRRIRYRVACADALGDLSAWTELSWVEVNVAYSFYAGQWMRPALKFPVMPYVRIEGQWVRHGGQIPDPASSRLGFGKLGDMILGG